MEDNNDAVFRQMTEQSDQVFFIYDPHKKRFTFVNAAFEAITKKSSKELYENPLPLLDMIHPADKEYVKHNFDLFGSNRMKSQLDFRIIRPDNVERWLRLKVYPIIEGQEVLYITGIAEDDSARKTSLFNMEKVTSWKDAILEIIAHDLRGPIGIISTLASTIAKDLPEGEYAQSHEWLKIIDKISKRNLELIRNLLSRESRDTSEIEISKERLDLVWEINEVMYVFMKAQQDISKKFVFTHSHEQVFAKIDSMKFLQIINNLISNAIKFTKDDGTIKVHLEKLDKSAVITVEDDGIGIPKTLHPFLFDRRTQAGRQGVNGEESLGLGMWIVRSLTEAHGGNVWFESEPRKGSKFYVELPLDL